MDGRVKTLHPRLYAGPAGAARRPSTLRAARRAGDRAGRPGVREPVPVRADGRARGRLRARRSIENIDIGGPTMIRAAAKNSAFAAVVVDPADYERVLDELRESDGRLSLATRRRAGRQGVRLHRPLRRGDRDLVRGAHLRGLPADLDARPTRRSATCATARTPTSRPPSTRASAPRRTCSPASSSCTARSSRSTTCSTSARRASWSRPSTSRRARSSSTTTRAAARSARRGQAAYETRVRLRPAERLRRRDRRQPARRPSLSPSSSPSSSSRCCSRPASTSRGAARCCRRRRTCGCSSWPLAGAGARGRSASR